MHARLVTVSANTILIKEDFVLIHYLGKTISYGQTNQI